MGTLQATEARRDETRKEVRADMARKFVADLKPGDLSEDQAVELVIDILVSWGSASREDLLHDVREFVALKIRK